MRGRVNRAGHHRTHHRPNRDRGPDGGGLVRTLGGPVGRAIRRPVGRFRRALGGPLGSSFGHRDNHRLGRAFRAGFGLGVE